MSKGHQRLRHERSGISAVFKGRPPDSGERYRRSCLLRRATPPCRAMPHQVTNSPAGACLVAKQHQIHVVQYPRRLSIAPFEPPVIASAYERECTTDADLIDVPADRGIES